jgi:hypothetical protein
VEGSFTVSRKLCSKRSELTVNRNFSLNGSFVLKNTIEQPEFAEIERISHRNTTFVDKVGFDCDAPSEVIALREYGAN